MKNTDEFTVEVRNCQTDNGETDIISETGTGTLRLKGGVWFIKYTTDAATVMIKLSGDSATVTRLCEGRSDMEYKLGQTTRFMYNTPYGAMEMELTTTRLCHTLTASGGKVSLGYDLCGIRNDMEITLRERVDI